MNNIHPQPVNLLLYIGNSLLNVVFNIRNVSLFGAMSSLHRWLERLTKCCETNKEC